MKVAIAGYGIEGKASFAYWSALGANVVIADERAALVDAPEGSELILGSDAFSQLSDFDIVVRSPSISPRKLAYKDKVWSATNEFFAKCPAPIIGVTGTKGKGTTCSLITSILRAAGKNVHLVGNIGTPALDILASITSDDIVIYELSSFQLWDLRVSPHIAVILAIEPDHLDVHSDFDDYLTAKGAIRKHQGPDDICYYHPTNEFSRQIATVGNWPEDEYEQKVWQAQAFRYATQEAVYVQDGNFMSGSSVICSTGAVRLPGNFNIENACAAISAARNFTLDSDTIEQGLRAFTGLPHRLKFVTEKNGISYYDDSIATTPGSAIAAMRSFDAPKVILLGGSNKGADYHEVVAVAKETGTKVVAIGQTGARIKEICDEIGVESLREEGLMPRVIAAANNLAEPGSVVILSPASASFDQYKSYSDRGDQFIAAVEEL